MLTKYNFCNYYTLGTPKIDVLEVLETEAAEAASINNQTYTPCHPSGFREVVFQRKFSG
jgi:hypothetical protein